MDEVASGAVTVDALSQWRTELADPATTTASLRRAANLAESLVRSRDLAGAVAVAEEALALATGLDVILDLRCIRAVAILDDGLVPTDLLDTANALIARADERWAAALDEVSKAQAQVASARDVINVDAARPLASAAARRLWQSMRLLFHRSLHTSHPLSPLAQSPDEWLSSLHSSALYLALQPSGRRRRKWWTTRKPSVACVTTGSSFLEPVVEAAIGAGMPVISLPLADLVSPRPSLAALLGERVVGLVDPEVSEAVVPGVLVGVDVVFVDWADEAAAWASVRLPVSGPRLVVRLHSVEALSAAVHVVDWSRVDRLVFVSEFLRRLTHAVVPATRSVDSVVVGHGVVSAGVGVKSAGAWSTLGMVGWGQVVKDPLFAVEVLALLRSRDPQRHWRLRLIGGSLENGARPWDAGYVDDFQRLVGEPLVAGAIEMTGFTDDVAAALEDVGFILSTSLREADPHGVVEGVLSGAVPVVRDWPVVAPWGGARELFPADWIVQTPEQAADRILSVTDPETVGRQAAAWGYVHNSVKKAAAGYVKALRP